MEDAIIRYNVAYEDEWLPVIQECGFAKAIPAMIEKYCNTFQIGVAGRGFGKWGM